MPLDVQYVDYNLAKSGLKGESLEAAKVLRKELDGAPDNDILPTDYDRPKELTYEGEIYQQEISGELLKKIKKSCEEEG